MLAISSVSKLVSAATRGSMLVLTGLAGSLGVLLVQSVGGYLYAQVSKGATFQFALWSYVALTVVTAALTLAGKLKI